MKTFLELCQARHSVRAYTERPVSMDDVYYVLDCMRLAPSAVNFQPWRFLLVQGDDCRKLQQCYANPWFKSVRTCIVALCDHRRSWKRNFDGKDHGDVDLGIVVAHFMLAAVDRGLSSCCVCNFNPGLFKMHFNLHDDLEPVAFLPLGYEDTAVAPRKPGRNKIEDLML